MVEKKMEDTRGECEAWPACRAQVNSRFGESQNYFSGAGVGVCVWYLSGSGIPSNEAKYNSLFLFFLSSFLLR